MARNTTAPAAVRCVDLAAPILKELSIIECPCQRLVIHHSCHLPMSLDNLGWNSRWSQGPPSSLR